MTKKKKTLDESLLSIKIIIVGAKGVLARSISMRAFSTKAKIPHKVHSIREVFGHRIINLSEVAYDLLQKVEIVPALIIIRSILESVAVLYFVKQKIERCINNNSIGNFDDKVMRILFGSRDDTTSLKAIHILNTFDEWNKETPYIRQMYYDLCEFTHPNYSGSEGSYAKIDKDKLQVHYEKNTQKDSYPYNIAISSLEVSLEHFVIFYDNIIDLLKDFAKLCEREIEEETRIGKSIRGITE